MTAWMTDDGRPIRDEIALDDLKAEPWAAPYDIGFAADAYHGVHLTGGALLTADTPEGLASAIRADIARRSARTGR